MDIMETIRDQVESNAVLLYMKGSPNQPQCGFSSKTVQSLMSCGHRFAYVDILSNPEIRSNLPTYGNWPTFRNYGLLESLLVAVISSLKCMRKVS